MFRLNINPALGDLLCHCHPARKRKIKASLRALASDPWLGKPLQEELLGLHSYRIGTWRVIYAAEAAKKTLHIITIGPRATVYKDLEKDLLRDRR